MDNIDTKNTVVFSNSHIHDIFSGFLFSGLSLLSFLAFFFVVQSEFGSNLRLHDKKVRENPSFAYAALRAAREKFASSDVSFIRAAGLGLEPR